jgi:hypothetical protein
MARSDSSLAGRGTASLFELVASKVWNLTVRPAPSRRLWPSSGTRTVRPCTRSSRPCRAAFAYTSVLTLLHMLEKKGHVRHEAHPDGGRAHLYKPLVQAGNACCQRYESLSVGLGESFVDEVEAIVARIEEAAAQFPVWEANPRVRKAVPRDVPLRRGFSRDGRVHPRPGRGSRRPQTRVIGCVASERSPVHTVAA